MLKFKRYRLPKNRKYKYVPRYASDDSERITGFTGKFKKNSFFNEDGNALDRREQWAEARKQARHRGNREINLRLIIIVAILVFLTLWVFDFDLSVFSIRQ